MVSSQEAGNIAWHLDRAMAIAQGRSLSEDIKCILRNPNLPLEAKEDPLNRLKKQLELTN
jgi:hypothetical protein